MKGEMDAGGVILGKLSTGDVDAFHIEHDPLHPVLFKEVERPDA